MVLRIFKNQLHNILFPEEKSIRATVIHWNLSQNVWGFMWPECKTRSELLFVFNFNAVGLRRKKINYYTMATNSKM